jgi:secondary thiamine-phosphate synthase enzyme
MNRGSHNSIDVFHSPLPSGKMTTGKFTITTKNSMELIDITAMVSDRLQAADCNQGICTLFNPHTTAGLTINEGADPAVRQDLITGFRKMVPMAHPFKHLEGNSPAHIMASLMGSSLTVFIEEGRLVLGTWQRIFFCEFDGPRTRSLHWQITRGE